MRVNCVFCIILRFPYDNDIFSIDCSGFFWFSLWDVANIPRIQRPLTVESEMAQENDPSTVPMAPVSGVSAPVAAPSTSPVMPATPVSAPAVSLPDSGVSTPAGGGFSLRELAVQRGYDPADFKDDPSLAAALLDAAERFAQAEPLANIGRQFAPYAGRMGEIEEYLKQKDEEAQVAAAEAAKAAEPPALEWRKAEYDPSWERYCQVNQQTGLWEPIHHDFAQYARKLNEATEARRLNSQRVVDDLPGLLDTYFNPRQTAIEKAVLKKVEELVEQQFQSRQQQTQTAELLKAHEKEWYVLDGAGQPAMLPNGEPKLSPIGEAVAHFAQEARSLGIADPGAIQKYALNMVDAAKATGKLVATSTPSVIPAPNSPIPGVSGQGAARNPNGRFLRRLPNADRLSQRAGNIPSSGEPHDSLSPMPDLREIVDRKTKEMNFTL